MMTSGSVKKGAQLICAALLAGAVGCVPGAGGNGTGDGAGAGKLSASVVNGALSAEISFEERAAETTFEVNMTGGAPGAVIDIVINGQVVATVTLDANGNAHAQYSSVPDDSLGDLPLPDDFPILQAGDEVGVGDGQGMFDEDDSDDENENDNGEANENENDNESDDSDDNANENDNDAVDDENVNENDNDGDDSDLIIELEAEVVGAGFFANAEYRAELDRVFLRVEVGGGTAGAVLSLSVAGVMLSDITLGAEGAIRVRYSDQPEANELPLPAGFPLLEVGDTVTVGGVEGLFMLDDNG